MTGLENGWKKTRSLLLHLLQVSLFFFFFRFISQLLRLDVSSPLDSALVLPFCHLGALLCSCLVYGEGFSVRLMFPVRESGPPPDGERPLKPFPRRKWRGWLGLLWIPPVSLVLMIVIGLLRECVLWFFPEIPQSQNKSFWDFLLSLPIWMGVLQLAVLPAVFEELLFRGHGILLLRRAWGLRASVFWSGFSFALAHLTLLEMILIFPLGLFLGWLRTESGNLFYPVLAHFSYNLSAYWLMRYMLLS